MKEIKKTRTAQVSIPTQVDYVEYESEDGLYRNTNKEMVEDYEFFKANTICRKLHLHVFNLTDFNGLMNDAWVITYLDERAIELTARYLYADRLLTSDTIELNKQYVAISYLSEPDSEGWGRDCYCELKPIEDIMYAYQNDIEVLRGI